MTIAPITSYSSYTPKFTYISSPTTGTSYMPLFGLGSYPTLPLSDFSISMPSLTMPSLTSFIPTVPFISVTMPRLLGSIKSGVKSAYNTVSSAVSSVGNKIVNIAKGYIGFNEKDGSYLRFTNGRREAWCADFVSYVCRQAGISGPSTASVEGIRQWGKNRGKYSKTAKVGSAVIFKNGTSHTGIVESVSNGRITCIEGNTSDKVARRTYSINDPRISGFVDLA